MSQGTLTIYSASAGSGKTFSLTGAYLLLLFRSRYNYRHILAVTFTNKATSEMKSRILDQLHILSGGGHSEYLGSLLSETGKSENEIRTEAAELLFSILHDYSRFSVSTIDAFFQKILRAFTREAGLHSGFNIELDHTLILSTAVDEMVASSGKDTDIRRWLTQYVLANLGEEKSWDLKGDIMKLAGELFRERYRMLYAADGAGHRNREFLNEYIRKLHSVKSSIENEILSLGRKCMKFMTDFNLTDDMFFQKGKGVPGFIRPISTGSVVRAGDNVMKILEDPPRWSTGKPSPELQAALRAGFDEAVKQAVSFTSSGYKTYKSAEAALSHIYALGILSDVLSRVHEIASSENSFLLSEAGEVLSLITQEDQTPFIYEKVGNTFSNYMIDEFQDTSWLQWKNFDPLISESMGRGNDNIVVGDIKQSIYRWRNSDWQILSGMKSRLVDGKRFLSTPLVTNWRSRSEVIRFNNSLFSILPSLIDETLSVDDPSSPVTGLYSEAVQKDPGKRNGGFVRIEFLKSDDKEKDIQTGDGIIRSWRDKVLDRLPSMIETFQDKGFRASDIGIIVREGKEGEDVVRQMITYAVSAGQEKKSRYNYNIVSGDSLSLSSSDALMFIISAFRVLMDPSDTISMAQMVRFYHLATGKDDPERVNLFHDQLPGGSLSCFPDGYREFMEKCRRLTLFEASESIIGFFGLGNYPWNVAYLDSFQDMVLNIPGNRSADFRSFLEWWEAAGASKSVVLPVNQDAIRVLTIHKSKGLEFPVVILPFVAWNLDHKPSKNPVLWVEPATEPFTGIDVLPVRYRKELDETVFAADYHRERMAVHIDNVNLLYVAMTRARDAMWCFAPAEPSVYEGVAKVLKNALTPGKQHETEPGMILERFYDPGEMVFETGVIPFVSEDREKTVKGITGKYPVTNRPGSLRLKLHAENYFSDLTRERINHGTLMHSVFENIDTAEDIPYAVRKLVLEGLLAPEEAAVLEERIRKLISVHPVNEWFGKETMVLKEAGILMPGGHLKRPDRIIMKEGRAVIVDFKFGVENEKHASQMRQYSKLLAGMGYNDTRAFLWYVDLGKITEV